MTDPDIVIPVRRGEGNEELRYALRSLQNLPHGNVWIAGHCPWWVHGVYRTPTMQSSTAHANVLKSITKVLKEPNLSENFVLWNDDFFLLRRVHEIPLLHRGPAGKEVARQQRDGSSVLHRRGLEETIFQLIKLGITAPLSYELHVPFPTTKTIMRRALDVIAIHWDQTQASARSRPPMVRTLAGNLSGGGGTLAADVKVTAAHDWSPLRHEPQGGLIPVEHWTFLSTNDEAFNRKPVGEFIRDLFPEPSPYEKTGSKR